MNRRHITAPVAIALIAIATPAFAQSTGGTVFDWIRLYWPMLLLGGGLVVSGVLLGLGTRFATTAAMASLTIRVDKIDRDCAARELRVLALEREGDAKPTRMELQEDISELSERMKGVETGLSGIHERLGTTNTYLHTLLEKSIPVRAS